MALDFARIKADIRIVDVLARRGISLRFNGEWGSAPCPLPSHKPGDKDRTFQVNVRENWFKCWSKSCNEKAGKKGGDVINLVAQLDNCSDYQAAKKLSEMFRIQEKTAQHIAERSEQRTSKRTISDSNSPSGKSNGYLHNVGLLLDDILTRGDQEDDAAYLKRIKKGAMTLVHQSYLNGKREGKGLPA
jgi:CHC2 zinc finger